MGEGGFFQVRGGQMGEISKFLTGRGSPPSRLIYIYIYIYIYTHYTYTYIKELHQQVFLYNEEVSCTSYTSCGQVAILLLQDLSTLYVTDVYGIYFRLSVQCQ